MIALGQYQADAHQRRWRRASPLGLPRRWLIRRACSPVGDVELRDNRDEFRLGWRWGWAQRDFVQMRHPGQYQVSFVQLDFDIGSPRRAETGGQIADEAQMLCIAPKPVRGRRSADTAG